MTAKQDRHSLPARPHPVNQIVHPTSEQTAPRRRDARFCVSTAPPPSCRPFPLYPAGRPLSQSPITTHQHSFRPSYKITKPQFEDLAQRVRTLQRLTERVCQTRTEFCLSKWGNPPLRQNVKCAGWTDLSRSPIRISNVIHSC